MDSNDLKKSGRGLPKGSPDLGSVPVQTGHSLESDDPIMPDWGLDLSPPVNPAEAYVSAQSFQEDFTNSESPSVESEAPGGAVRRLEESFRRTEVVNDHYSDPKLMPQGWIRHQEEIRANRDREFPPDLRGWLIEGSGRELMNDTAWLLTVPDPQEARIFVALSEVEIGPGDLLALGRPWEPAEIENVRCKHLVRGDCFRLTPNEWSRIYLAAFADRAVFRVLPGSKLGAMPLPTE
jgi:hypothetical protein